MEPTGEHCDYDPSRLLFPRARVDRRIHKAAPLRLLPLSHSLTKLVLVGSTFVLFVCLLLKDFAVTELDFMKIVGSEMRRGQSYNNSENINVIIIDMGSFFS